MAEPWDTYYWRLDTQLLTHYNKLGLVQDEMYDLSVALTAEGNPNSGSEAYAMSIDQSSLQTSWYGGSYTFKNRLLVCLQYLMDRIDAMAGVSMDSILTAMMAASFEQLREFMGITQAYKSAVWDAPFNEEYYAALARGFKEWGIT